MIRETVVSLLTWGVVLILVGGIATLITLILTSSSMYTILRGFMLLFSVSTIITGIAFPLIALIFSLYKKLTKKIKKKPVAGAGEPTIRKVCLVLTLVIWTSTTGGLWKFSRGFHVNKRPQNELEAWTRGYLTDGTYLKIDKQKFIGGSAMQATKGVYFWVVNSTTDKIITTTSKVVPGPWGVPVTIVKGATVYQEDDIFIFPFTINIPKAKTQFQANKGEGTYWTITENKKGWDTWYFECKKVKNGHTEKIQKWLLDADTRLPRQIILINKKPMSPKPEVKVVYDIVETSMGLRGTDELHTIATTSGYMGLIIGSLSLVVIIYKKRGGSTPIEKEKKRLESEEYQEKALEKYEKKKERLERL